MLYKSSFDGCSRKNISEIIVGSSMGKEEEKTQKEGEQRNESMSINGVISAVLDSSAKNVRC